MLYYPPLDYLRSVFVGFFQRSADGSSPEDGEGKPPIQISHCSYSGLSQIGLIYDRFFNFRFW